MTSTDKTKAAHQRGEQLSDFIYHIASRDIPDAVLHEAKRALIDHLAVATGAVNDEAVLPRASGRAGLEYHRQRADYPR